MGWHLRKASRRLTCQTFIFVPFSGEVPASRHKFWPATLTAVAPLETVHFCAAAPLQSLMATAAPLVNEPWTWRHFVLSPLGWIATPAIEDAEGVGEEVDEGLGDADDDGVGPLLLLSSLISSAARSAWG